MQRNVGAGGMWQMAAQWYSGTTHTQIDTSHNGKCLISSVLVWKIYKWDIFVRFVVWIQGR